MKIKFNEDYSGIGRNFKADGVYNVNDAKAMIYVRSGIASAADEKAELTLSADEKSSGPRGAKAAK